MPQHHCVTCNTAAYFAQHSVSVPDSPLAVRVDRSVLRVPTHDVADAGRSTGAASCRRVADSACALPHSHLLNISHISSMGSEFGEKNKGVFTGRLGRGAVAGKRKTRSRIRNKSKNRITAGQATRLEDEVDDDVSVEVDDRVADTTGVEADPRGQPQSDFAQFRLQSRQPRFSFWLPGVAPQNYSGQP